MIMLTQYILINYGAKNLTSVVWAVGEPNTPPKGTVLPRKSLIFCFYIVNDIIMMLIKRVLLINNDSRF